MPCYGPLVGYFSKVMNDSTGKRPITFSKLKAFSGVPISLPCGKCVGCRLSWRRQWAVRCMHEKRMYNASAFVTLTYDDVNLPSNGSLSLTHLQKFMKRLRRVRPTGLRFFGCGEYGDASQRPHYHLLLFNTDFEDRKFVRQSPTGSDLFRSAEVTRLWPMGDNLIGSVDAKSCAYVAGYVMKKVGSERDYGARLPEFRVMSRRPGIGKSWHLAYWDEAFRHDSAIMDQGFVPLPRYYDEMFRELDEDMLVNLKTRRRREDWKFRNEYPEERSKARMWTREQFELAKQSRFAREGV